MPVPRIIIVEDDEFVAEDLMLTLRDHGYEVPPPITTGEEAVQKARETVPDLILMDIVLRGSVDGIEAARRIRSEADVPIVYLTAFAGQEFLDRARRTEPFGYLLKPFRVEELCATVEMVLHRHHIERQLRENEQRCLSILELQTELVCRYLPNGTITFVNEAFCRYFHKRREELVGSSFTRLIPEEDREAIELHLLSLTPCNPVASHEHRMIMSDGQLRWQRWTTLGIFDQDGALVEIQGVGEDVTALREAEQARQLAQDQLEQWVHERALELDSKNVELLNEVAERRKAEEAALRQARLVKGINRVLRETLLSESERDVAKACLRVAEEITDSEFGWIGEVNQQGRLDTTALSDPGWSACRIPKSHAVRAIRNLQIRGIWGSVIEKREAEIVEDPASHPHFRGTPQGHPPIERFLGVPLKRFGEPFGMVALANKPSGYSAEDVQDIKDLSVSLVEALDHCRAKMARRESERILAMRDRIAHAFLTASETDLYSEVLAVIVDVLKSQYGMFGYLDANGALVCPSVSPEIKDVGQSAGEAIVFPREQWSSIWGEALVKRTSICANQPLSVVEGHILLNRALAAPITHAHGVIGVIFVANKQTDYQDRDQRLLETIGEYIAPILYSRLRWLAEEKERLLAEAALRESEEMQSRILATSPVGIAFVEEGKLKWMNQAMADIFGYAEGDDYLGKDVREFYASQEEYARAQRAMFKDMPEGRQGSVDAHFRRKDGSTFVGHIRISAPDPVAPEKTFIAAMLDITERKAAEEALQRNEEMLRTILATCPVGLGFTKDREIIWTNEAWSRIFRFDNPEQVVGKNTRILYPSDEEYERVGRELYRNLGSGETAETDARFERQDGTLFDARVRMNALDPSDLGKGTIASITDISGRRRAEQELRASEMRYRALFNNSIDGVFVTTPEGRFIDANESLLSLLQFTRDELQLVNVADLYAEPGARAKFQQEMERRWFVKDYPVKFRKKDGMEIHCLMSCALWRDESGEVLGYQGILRDITESQRLEARLRQAQKMESLGTLAGGIAHDFNNILTVVAGYCELLLLEQQEGSKSYEDLRIIHHAAQRGADLVRRILTFSRKVETVPRRVDLNEVITNAQKLLYRTVPRMIEIELHLADDLKPIEADAAQIDQVLMNLAVNAAHAMTDRGTFTIKTENVTIDEAYAQTHLELEPGDYALLTVSDTGNGMERDVLERIFEPFFTTKQAGEGTGLGLAMVYGIVKGHGGHITCSSEPGLGTTFKIYFPVREGETDPDVAIPPESAAAGTETILVVDDDEDVRILGERILASAGYSVLTAENGKEALDVYRTHQDEIALVMLDLIMPVMGGRQCLEELLKLDPQVKVVVASGFSPSGLTTDVVGAGAQAFVRKPFKMHQLLHTVHRVLKEEGKTAETEPEPT